MPLLRRNGDVVHYEVHGDGPTPALCMGGWGTFCHGRTGDIPRALMTRFRVVVFDYPGVGESSVTQSAITTPALAVIAADVLDAAGIDSAHLVGLVGMGACVAQELAIRRPERVESLVMTGAWARPDPTFADQLELFRKVHLEMGFETFQLLCAAYSFDPDFYAANRDRILGPSGAWSALQGRAEAHAALVSACLAHDTLDRLRQIIAPTLILHAGADVITGPRLTLPLERGIPGARGESWADLAHIIAGRDLRARFDSLLDNFYSGLQS